MSRSEHIDGEHVSREVPLTAPGLHLDVRLPEVLEARHALKVTAEGRQVEPLGQRLALQTGRLEVTARLE